MSQNPKVITSYCTNGLVKIFKKRFPFSVKVDEEITKAHPEWKEYFALNWDPFTDFPDDLIKDSKVILFFFNLSNKDSVDLLKDFQNFLKKKEEALKTCGALYIIAQLVEGEKSLIDDSQIVEIAKKCNCKFEKIKDYKEIDSIFNKAIREIYSI